MEVAMIPFKEIQSRWDKWNDKIYYKTIDLNRPLLHFSKCKANACSEVVQIN